MLVKTVGELQEELNQWAPDTVVVFHWAEDGTALQVSLEEGVLSPRWDRGDSWGVAPYNGDARMNCVMLTGTAGLWRNNVGRIQAGD